VSGIDAGAKVILEGKQNLRSGALVKERVEAEKAEVKKASKSSASSVPAASAS
jgi:hypothetical protein